MKLGRMISGRRPGMRPAPAMRRGAIVAAFAGGLTFGAALPLLGQATLPTLPLELYGVPRSHSVYIACTEASGAPISGGTPSFNPASVSYGGVGFSAVRVQCS